jgi:hypothetical protein
MATGNHVIIVVYIILLIASPQAIHVLSSVTVGQTTYDGSGNVVPLSFHTLALLVDEMCHLLGDTSTNVTITL